MSRAKDELLHVIFTTALEGGINYWASPVKYHWMLRPAEGEAFGDDDTYGFYAEIILDEEPGEEHRVINRDVMVRGYRLASTEHRSKIAWSTEPPPLVITDDTDWDFDAGDADCIVQLGLLGEVRYG